MQNESENLKRGVAVFEKLLANESLILTMITGKKKDQAAVVSDVAQSIANNPEAQQAFLRALIGTLSKEGERCVTDRRDAAIGILSTPAVVDLLPAFKLVIFNAYLEALAVQHKDNDPYGGSIDSLLQAGLMLAPYFPQDNLSIDQLKFLLGQLAKPFLPGAHRYIQSFADEMLESITLLGSRDAQVKYWKLRKWKNTELAVKLGISVPLVGQSVQRLIEDGELKSKEEQIRERADEVLTLMLGGCTIPEMTDNLDSTADAIATSIKQLYKEERIDSATWEEKKRERKQKGIGKRTIQQKVSGTGEEGTKSEDQSRMVGNIPVRKGEEDEERADLREREGGDVVAEYADGEMSDSKDTGTITREDAGPMVSGSTAAVEPPLSRRKRWVDTKVEPLKAEGLSDKRISALLGIPVREIARSEQRLLDQKRIEKTPRRTRREIEVLDDTVARLINEGFNVEEIAEKLIKNPSTIIHSIGRLQRQERIGRVLIRRTPEELAKFDERVATLKTQGMKRKEIANNLSVEEVVVKEAIDRINRRTKES